jgi:hypothetical protein
MAAPPSLVDSHFVPTMHCCLSSHVLEGDHDSFITEWSVTGGGERLQLYSVTCKSGIGAVFLAVATKSMSCSVFIHTILFWVLIGCCGKYRDVPGENYRPENVGSMSLRNASNNPPTQTTTDAAVTFSDSTVPPTRFI